MLSIWENKYKVGTIMVITILYDRFFIYRTVNSYHLKKIKKWYEK